MKKITILLTCIIFCAAGTTLKAQTMGNLWGMTAQGGDSAGGTMFGFDPITKNDSVIIPFSALPATNPEYGNNIIQTSKGTFYGITSEGGAHNDGAIFKRTASGTTILHSFNNDGVDGYVPYGSIMMAADGKLYGMCTGGGANGDGIIFKCDTLGNYRVIHAFSGSATNGRVPQYGGLTQAANGTLFGMTESGGVNDEGAIFKCDTAGNLTVIHSFGVTTNDGTYPYNSVTFGTNGKLYGMTYEGGVNSSGTVFTCDTLGNEKVIYNFYTATDNSAYYPYGNLIQAPNGTLFGMVVDGGSQSAGIIFKCDTLGNNLHVLYNFGTISNDGQYPYGSLVFGNGDTLYGYTYDIGGSGSGILFKCDTNTGSGYGILHNFGSQFNDGEQPYSAPIVGVDGNLYGVAYEGGRTGQGTMFEYNFSSATESTIYNFGTNTYGSDGLENFIQGKDGNLYGMAHNGGAHGNGTILKYNPVTGKTTILHTFYDTATDGAFPDYGHLVQGSNSMLYGVAYDGGVNGNGVLFECSTSGAFNVLYSFGANPGDGYYPTGGLVIGKNWGLYGMTQNGGANGVGTIFKCDTLGNETILYNFGTNTNDANNPTGSLIQSVRGTFYGLASNGGANTSGVIFKCDTSGNETVLYSFGAVPNDGTYPNGSLILGRDGMLFGTASSGGTNGNGTVFKSDTLGNETTLYNFGTGIDGNSPMGSLILGSDSNMYGTTQYGGTIGDGTIFKCDTLGNESVLYSFTGGSDGESPQMDLLEMMNAKASLLATNCSGTEVTSSVRGAFAPYTYMWSNGSTSSTDTIKTAGTYTLTVTDARGITVTTTVTTTYNVVNVTASNTSLCNGLSTSLSANGTGGSGSLTYTWMPGSLSGSSPSVNPSSTTTYTVVVKDGSSCMDSAKEVVTVNPTPTVIVTGHDTILAGNSDTLTATGGTSYSWVGGGPVNPYIVSPVTNETYTVTVTNSFGCSTTDTFKVVVELFESVQNLTLNSTSVYPNPTVNILNLLFKVNAATEGTIQIEDITGKVITSTQQLLSNNEAVQLNVSNLDAGVYFVRIVTGKQTQVIKFVKQ